MFTQGETVERIDPKTWDEACSNRIVRQHSNRYIWAAEVLKDVPYIADIACGVGYGTAYLARSTQAIRVLGIDKDKRAIKHAKKYFREPNTMYLRANLAEDKTYQWPAIVCFETIEHLEDDLAFIKNIAGWLGKNGTLLISAPNEAVIPLKGSPNPYHYRHYTPNELEAILAPHFEIREVRFQNEEGDFVDKENMIVIMYCIKKG